MSWDSIKILMEANMLWLVAALVIGLVVGWRTSASNKD